MLAKIFRFVKSILFFMCWGIERKIFRLQQNVANAASFSKGEWFGGPRQVSNLQPADEVSCSALSYSDVQTVIGG